MIRRSFIKIYNLISDKMINDKFYYFIENKNKNGNTKFMFKSKSYKSKNYFSNTLI